MHLLPFILMVLTMVAATFAHAADCDGIDSVCTPAQLQQSVYDVCDENGAFSYLSNAWTQCHNEVLEPDKPRMTTEQEVRSLSACFLDKVSSCKGSRLDALRWSSHGQEYHSNLCYLITSSDAIKFAVLSGTLYRKDEQGECRPRTFSGGLVARVMHTLTCPSGTTKITFNGQTVCKRPVIPDVQTCSRQDGMLVGNPIQPATAEKLLTETDYRASSPDGLHVVRQWVSGRVPPGVRDSAMTDMGHSWTHNHFAVLRWHVLEPRIAGIAPQQQARIFLPDGNVRIFVLSPNTGDWLAPGHPWLHLEEHTGGGHVYRDDRAGHVLVFNAQGQLLRRQFRNGWVHRYQYNDFGQLASITNQFGRSLVFAYTSSQPEAFVSSITTPAGVLHYHYDQQGNLTGVQYPDGSGRQYEYAHAYPHLITGIRDQSGQRLTSYYYDDRGRAIGSYLRDGDKHLNRHGASYWDYDSPGILQQKEVNISDPLYGWRNYRYNSRYGRLAVTEANTPPADPSQPAIHTRVQDDDGYVSTETDFLGNQTRYIWDKTRGLLLQRSNDTTSTHTQWHASHALPEVVTQGNKQTRYQYDHLGQVLSRTMTDTRHSNTSQTWTYRWNPQGLLAAQTDPGGATTTYTYDRYGNLTSSRNALGHTTHYAYDSADRLIRITDPNGTVIHLQRDAAGRITTRRLQHAHASATETDTFTYTARGQLQSASLASGLQLQYQYDGAGRLTTVRDSAGNQVSYELDDAGNRKYTTVTNPDGSTAWKQRTIYNYINRIQEIIDTNYASTRYGYDANGRPISQTNALGAHTQQQLDAQGRPVTITLADQASAHITYDEHGHSTNATDPGGTSTQWQVNALGQVLHSHSPDTGSSQTTYDSAGRIASHTDAGGNTTTYTYDIIGRTTSITHIAANTTTAHDYQPRITQRSTHFTYDRGHNAIGRITKIHDQTTYQQPQRQHNTTSQTQRTLHTITSYTYDGAGHISSTRQHIKDGHTTLANQNTQWQYVPGGKPGQLTLPSGARLTYHYNNGWLHAIHLNGKPLISHIRYNANGQLLGWKTILSGGQTHTTERIYDVNARLIRTGSWQYTYDTVGRITHIHDSTTPHNPIQLQYDRRDRLTQFGSTAYTWDANSNRTAPHLQYQSGSNRLTHINGQPLHPNSNGAATQWLTGSLIHDPAGQIAAYSHQPGSEPASTISHLYLHNNQGQRTFKTDPIPWQITPTPGNLPQGWNHFINWWRALFKMPLHATPTSGLSFVYDQQGRLLGQYHNHPSHSSQQREYIWLPDNGYGMLAVILDGASSRTTGSIYTIETDHLGTPRTIHNAANQRIWYWPYSGFGEVPPETTETAPAHFHFNLRYVGQYFDEESGLHENWHRSYDPQTGRYTSADPIGLAGGWNRFGYVDGNPIWAVDPTGESGVFGVFAGIAIEIGVQAVNNYMNSCKLFDVDSYNWARVGIAGAIGFYAPGWFSVARNTRNSLGAISTLRKQMNNSQSLSRQRKLKSRISKHEDSILEQISIQASYQFGGYIGKEILDEYYPNKRCGCNDE